jgi:hypothetical protein
MLWMCVTASCASAACAVVLCLTTALGAGDAPDENAQKNIAELEAQVAELEKSVEALGKIVEGTAHPINLGRTSLARVCASSVNGNRSLTNEHYGVLNAFDDGDNWIGNINYSSWLSGGDAQPWIEVVFDRPVSVTSIVVEGAPPFTTRLDFAKGGEQVEAATAKRLKLDAIAHGVIKVRLTFERTSGNTEVHEVRIMGYVPPGVEYAEGRPRLFVTEREVRAIAAEAYRAWTEAFLPRSSDPKVIEQDGAMTFTYHRDGVEFVRVTVEMSSGDVKVEPLIRVIESRPDAVADPPKDTAADPAKDPAAEPPKDAAAEPRQRRGSRGAH